MQDVKEIEENVEKLGAERDHWRDEALRLGSNLDEGRDRIGSSTNTTDGNTSDSARQPDSLQAVREGVEGSGAEQPVETVKKESTIQQKGEPPQQTGNNEAGPEATNQNKVEPAETVLEDAIHDDSGHNKTQHEEPTNEAQEPKPFDDFEFMNEIAAGMISLPSRAIIFD
jgi:hypothetical protein